MECYTFPISSLSNWGGGGVNLSEILKFAAQNSYSKGGACNWFYAKRIIGRGLILSGGLGRR